MTRCQIFAALVTLGACAHPASQPRTIGPVIGESTATGPADPSAPPPDPGGVTEVSRPLHGAPSPVANPAITVDTMPSTTGSAATSTPSTTVISGAGTGPAPVGAAPGASPTTAGPNGPGTGNATTPTGAATGGAAPGATNTAPPAAPPTNGPGSGNTVNRPAPVPAQPIPPAAPSTPTVPQR